MNKLKIGTTLKAKDIIGIGPIEQADVNWRWKDGETYEDAKRMAVQDFLENRLQYNSEEIKEMGIMQTKMAKDKIIYITVEEHSAIKELYIRKAECQDDDDLVLRTYIPPQFYAHFTAINRICKDKRIRDPLLKTQIRFETKDFEILTKEKGSEETFRPIKMADFIGKKTIPEFDASIKWTQQTDRPPRKECKTKS